MNKPYSMFSIAPYYPTTSAKCIRAENMLLPPNTKHV